MGAAANAIAAGEIVSWRAMSADEAVKRLAASRVDAAGKGGVIKRITQSLKPRICRVVALGAPIEREERINNPVKRWKLSTMDLESRRHWVEYSKAKDVMLAHTDREKTPWWVVNADDKKRARLNCIAHLLKQIPYHDMSPVEIEVPPRQDDIGYKRPKKSNQRFVPEVY